MLDGSTMQYEKRTITSFVKYRRRENGQYLQAAIIIEEKGKKKEKRRKKQGNIVLERSTMQYEKRTITSFMK